MCDTAEVIPYSRFSFFCTDAAATAIYTLSLHDALPIYRGRPLAGRPDLGRPGGPAHHRAGRVQRPGDRKSTRLNSSHVKISYAVFCLKKKKTTRHRAPPAAGAATARRPPLDDAPHVRAV